MTKKILKGFKWCVSAAGLSIAGVAIVAYIGDCYKTRSKKFSFSENWWSY
jgi:hypothetical protein